MPKKPEKVTLDHDFVFTTDADFDEKLTAFRGEHEAVHGQILAMDSKRSLGPGKLRVTFRVIDKKGKKR